METCEVEKSSYTSLKDTTSAASSYMVVEVRGKREDAENNHGWVIGRSDMIDGDDD